jgi:hypothetical protein
MGLITSGGKAKKLAVGPELAAVSLQYSAINELSTLADAWLYQASPAKPQAMVSYKASFAAQHRPPSTAPLDSQHRL